MKSKTIIITVLVVLTGVLLYRIYKAGESIVLAQDIDRIGQRRQDNGNMDKNAAGCRTGMDGGR